ncbi:transglutaminase family protein [soil metagenome]
MRVRVGCEFKYRSGAPVPTTWQVRPRSDLEHTVLEATWESLPHLPVTSYQDVYGNPCDRLVLPGGPATVRYDALVEVPSDFDAANKGAVQLPVQDLPNETLIFILPSRFCPSDLLGDEAWRLFGATEPGWPRVQAICDWVHENLHFDYGDASPLISAVEVYEARTGVCRDFTHLAITFCRAFNVPCRYTFGYLPDIGVVPPDAPMDFCAWFEAYLDGRWWTFDPRNNEPRTGRVVCGQGRDALDVAMVTTYGSAVLESMTVWADTATL